MARFPDIVNTATGHFIFSVLYLSLPALAIPTRADLSALTISLLPPLALDVATTSTAPLFFFN